MWECIKFEFSNDNKKEEDVIAQYRPVKERKMKMNKDELWTKMTK